MVGVEFKDQRVYRLTPGAAPVPLTPESGGALRYADLVLDLPRQRLLAVREDHAGRGLGRQLVERLIEDAAGRGFAQVLALTRRVGFFEALGFKVTQRELYLEKLVVDCAACPMNLCCDETAVVRPVAVAKEERKDLQWAV